MAFALSCALAVIPSSQAQKATPTEYEVKAAYLYNFGRFVEWPNQDTAQSAGPFSVCVLGEDPFGHALDATLAGGSINGASTTAIRISKAKEAVNCRILFISSSEESQLKQILGALEGSSVLTVSDLPQFSQRGGMVQFVLDGKKVRFEVNLTPVEHAHLAMSSELLKVAVNLRRNNRLGD
ncbi:MAG: YfiR family protein [Candidatus Sulfotelmatobacter sp.]